MTTKIQNKHILMILDGYGIAVDPSVSAIDKAKKPFLDGLFNKHPHATLEASGLAVGLPVGQMGNSEVGHMNLGAGRVVFQDITRIDKAIADGEFFRNPVLIEACRHARDSGGRLHLLGLFSDGGVHSHLTHLEAILDIAARANLPSDRVLVHAFMDGRDTDPHGGAGFARSFEEAARRIGVGRIASVIGRYWAMDRDKRWERTKRAYDLLVQGGGSHYPSSEAALRANYDNGITDEFVEPCLIGDEASGGSSRIQKGDTVVYYNFRADRTRQLTQALTDDSFHQFERSGALGLHFVTFTNYSSEFDFPVVFEDVNLKKTIGEVISEWGGSQLRAAETEKYPHVTYFFSGGREDPFPDEDRLLVASPKVATYDLQPEMSAPELAQKVAEALRQKSYNLVVLNFANPDMVGHTGVFEAAVEAVEAVDAAAQKVVEAALELGYGISIIADHGNADCMMNPDGSPFTAHTTALVPHLIIKEGFAGPVRDGKLGDVAPTILRLLDLPIPPEMTGDILV